MKPLLAIKVDNLARLQKLLFSVLFGNKGNIPKVHGLIKKIRW